MFLSCEPDIPRRENRVDLGALGLSPYLSLFSDIFTEDLCLPYFSRAMLQGRCFVFLTMINQ